MTLDERENIYLGTKLVDLRYLITNKRVDVWIVQCLYENTKSMGIFNDSSYETYVIDKNNLEYYILLSKARVQYPQYFI